MCLCVCVCPANRRIRIRQNTPMMKATPCGLFLPICYGRDRRRRGKLIHTSSTAHANRPPPGRNVQKLICNLCYNNMFDFRFAAVPSVGLSFSTTAWSLSISINAAREKSTLRYIGFNVSASTASVKRTTVVTSQLLVLTLHSK